ncbi:MAG: alginate O-acetyltransferase AlgF [Trueperaceae bacterium]
MPQESDSGAGCRHAAGNPGARLCRLAAIFMPGPVATLVLASVLAVSATAAAQGLYGPEAPRDVAYLRLINADSRGPVTMSVDGSEWQPLPYAEVSPYRQLPPGEHLVTLAGEEIAISASPEGFITVVALEGRALLLEDEPLRDISRGLLTFYNLTAGDALSLRTQDGGDVLTDVAAESAASVAISEAEVGLAVHHGEELLASLEPRLYGRGEAHAVIVLPAGKEPRLVYARAGAEP